MRANQQVLTPIREMNQYYKKETGGVHPGAGVKTVPWDRVRCPGRGARPAPPPGGRLNGGVPVSFSG